MNTYLCLQQRQQSTTDQGLTIKRGTKMVRIVATGRDIGHIDESTEGVLTYVNVC